MRLISFRMLKKNCRWMINCSAGWLCSHNGDRCCKKNCSVYKKLRQGRPVSRMVW